MERILKVLRDEIKKYDAPFIRFFRIEKLDRDGLNQEEILEILQQSFMFFSVAENLESKSSKWNGQFTIEVYEMLRAIISLDALPDKERLKKVIGLKLTETELIGFLYVAHLLKFNGHQFSCRLAKKGLYPESLMRTYSNPLRIMKSWDSFLTNCQNYSEALSAQELKNGAMKAIELLKPAQQ